MADGDPKDYSQMYFEDNSNSSSLIATNSIKPPIPSNRSTNATSSKAYKSLDGSFVQPKHREQNIDLGHVVSKLQNLHQDNHLYAIDTLKKHYSSVFTQKRRTPEQQTQKLTNFKAYIQYFDEKETYVVRVERNTLGAVRDKLPKRGNYRYFFKGLENTCEEIEFEDSLVPFHEKDGLRQIYCQVFPP